jgi:hypothetical protein|tara:strand:- start:925 stop:1077 length:153 start_codon:yes stop_codon:yes gene_type:complete
MTKEEWLSYLPNQIRDFYIENKRLTSEQLSELHKLKHEWLWVYYLENHIN